jgi:hypothetical protein
MSKNGLFFYSVDEYIRDTRSLTPEARACWVDWLCILSENHGLVAWPVSALGQYSGVSEEVARHVLNQLSITKVAEVEWPSETIAQLSDRRMLKHCAVREQLSAVRKEVGKAGLAKRWQTDSKPIAKAWQLPSTPKAKPAKPEFALPDWIDLSAWAGFVAMRVKIKKPMTDRAKQMLVTKLEAFKAAGADVAAILRQSEFKCWQDVYALKTEETTGRVPVPKYEPAKDEEIPIEKRRENIDWLKQTLSGIGKGMK